MRLDILANRIQPQSTFVFYLSGHGILRDDQAFLLATNSVITTPNTLEISVIEYGCSMYNRILTSIFPLLIIISSTSAAMKINSFPSEFNILSSYPNPFNPTTTLSLHLPISTNIIVDILNIKGQRIERIYEGYMHGGISHNLNWDGTVFSSGIYFIYLTYDKKNIIHKMTLLK